MRAVPGWRRGVLPFRARRRGEDDRSRSSPTARSLRRRFLLPFAAGVALIGVAAGGAGAWGARAAADAELENRANTSLRIFRQAVLAQQARLEREATHLGAMKEMSRAIATADSTGLADLGVPNTISNRFDYVAVVGLRGEYVYSSRTSDWSMLRSRALVASATAGIAEGGLAVASDGTAVVFAAVPVRVPGARSGVIIIGEPVNPVNLEELVRPLDLTMELRTKPGKSVNSLGGGPDARPSVRTFSYPTEVSRFSAGQATLRVGLSSAPLHRATASAAATAALVAFGVALSLLLIVAVLLDHAVLRPLRRLRAGITEVEHGRYDVILPSSGVREFVDVAAGFQHMAAMVGEQQARLREQAARDSLTGLANHASFHAELNAAAVEAQRAGKPLAVIVLDIDHFKQINDGHGHPYGDEVLRAVARRLAEAMRGTDVAARLGGDEFAVLLRSTGAAQAAEVAGRLCADLRLVPVAQERLSVSLGIGCFPAHTDQPASLVEVADRALYDAKRGGRGQVRSHVTAPAFAASHVDAVRAAELAQVRALLDLPEPIAPAYQPLIALNGGAVLGYEALARFPSDPGSSPEVWFARAHRCGLGPALEARAITAALRIPDRRGFLALNISISALLSPEVAAALPAALGDVIIEITENEPVTDEIALQRCLSDLRGRGARIALDDAGSGYAGLRQLLLLRPELLKIDRCLIEAIDTEPDRQAIVEALLVFARRTGALVCAEGVETPGQLRTLANMGVDIAQGFFLAGPWPPWAPLTPAAATVLGPAVLHHRPHVAGVSAIAGPPSPELIPHPR